MTQIEQAEYSISIKDQQTPTVVLLKLRPGGFDVVAWPAMATPTHLYLPPRPVLDRLGQMSGFDALGADQVGDGAGQLEGAVVGAGAHV